MFKHPIRFIFVFLLSLSIFNVAPRFSFAQTSEEVEERIQEDVMERYPDLEEFNLENQLIRVIVDFELRDTSYVLNYSSKGKWQSTLYSIDVDDLPEEVKDGYDKSKYAVGWEITAAEVYEKSSSRELQYRLTVSKNQLQKKYLYFNHKGRLLKDVLTL